VVHVTEGTIHARRPLVLSAAATGLGGLPMDVIMTTGRHRAAAELGFEGLAPNVRIEPWVAHSALLPRTDVIVTTGGAGTVLAALLAGVPLLIVPTEWDKPESARRVEHAGAGLILPPHRCTPARLRAAVQALLADGRFRQNAERLGAALRRCGGAPRGAELIERTAHEWASRTAGREARAAS
jgi:MGT family glycosyltransferase